MPHKQNAADWQMVQKIRSQFLKFDAKGRFSQVRGEFNLHSDNHGKPVYKKNGQAWLFGIFE